MIKTLQKVGIAGTYLNIIKTIYTNPCKHHFPQLKTESISSQIRTKQGCPLSSLLFTTVLEDLDKAVREEKEMKGIQIGKEEVKLSLFADDIIHTQKILKMQPENYQSSSMNLVKLKDTKLIYRNILHYYTLTSKDQNEKLRQ